MTATAHTEARSLIVVSRDHGEFGFAMTFLRGQAFASRTTILLPDNLYANNKDSLPDSALRYGTMEDILGVVDRHKPDLVFLFSGYLFSHDGLLSPESLDTLLRRLRDRGCGVITSDPFLGLAQQLTLAQIDTRMGTSRYPASTRWLRRLVLRLLGPRTKVISVPSLEHVTHLYPTWIPESEDRIARLSFFNPTIIRAAKDSGAARDGREHGEPHDSRPGWLFVLSASDLHCQRLLLGVRGLIRVLAGMFWYAVEAERRPTLIAPPWIVKQLANRLPDAVELLPFCPFAEFEKRVFDAEYVFYWNAFSFSQLARLANELPVFLFDRGHLARTVKPFYEIARACHLGGWEPIYLDQRQPLDPRTLDELGEKQKPAMRMMRERWQSLPTPDELVDRLVHERANPREPE